MAARVELAFAKSAEDDLRDILAWHASQQVPEIGMRMVATVVERVEQLAEFPDSGKMVPEFEAPWLRELVFPPYRIVYRRDETVVTVVRVWRCERLMDPELGGSA